jgi:hypothetical protein
MNRKKVWHNESSLEGSLVDESQIDGSLVMAGFHNSHRVDRLMWLYALSPR